MDGRRRKTVHTARRPEERPKDASHSSTFTECTAAMLTLPSFAGPTSARSVTRTVRMRFSVGTRVDIIGRGADGATVVVELKVGEAKDSGHRADRPLHGDGTSNTRAPEQFAASSWPRTFLKGCSTRPGRCRT